MLPAAVSVSVAPEQKGPFRAAAPNLILTANNRRSKHEVLVEAESLGPNRFLKVLLTGSLEADQSK